MEASEVSGEPPEKRKRVEVATGQPDASAQLKQDKLMVVLVASRVWLDLFCPEAKTLLAKMVVPGVAKREAAGPPIDDDASAAVADTVRLRVEFAGSGIVLAEALQVSRGSSVHKLTTLIEGMLRALPSFQDVPVVVQTLQVGHGGRELNLVKGAEMLDAAMLTDRGSAGAVFSRPLVVTPLSSREVTCHGRFCS